MSLSPFDSFQSRFVTYLLNFSRISISILKIFLKIRRRAYHSLSVTHLEQSSKQRKRVEWNFSAVKSVKSCTSVDEVVFLVLNE